MECAREIELRQRARILDTSTNVIKDALDILNSQLSPSSSDGVEKNYTILDSWGSFAGVRRPFTARYAM